MKLRELIEIVDDYKPNAFSDAAKTAWVNEVEGVVQTDIMLVSAADVIEYDYEEDSETELLVPAPWHKLYRSYLEAMIDYHHAEYNLYATTLERANEDLDEYRKWYFLYVHPIDGKAEYTGYYLSAYAIAVKHGYEGTEEDWLDTLGGADGVDGVSPAVEITALAGGHMVTITDKEHPAGQSFNVADGADGEDGADGADGVSPEITASKSGKVTTLTIVDAEHPSGATLATIRDGADGAGTGDMTKAAYDDDDTVENAGGIAAYVAANVPSVTGKADKVSNATNGNFAALDSNGNLTDSGHKHSDYLTSHQDISGKQDVITASGILKGAGGGSVSAAVAGTDYQAPLTAGTDYVTPAALNTMLNRTTAVNVGDNSYSTAMARAIYAGTTDMTPGTTDLTSGVIYLYYEA